MSHLELIPILRRQSQYLEDNKDNSVVDLLQSYTGHEELWIKLQDYLRAPFVKSYVELLYYYRTLENAKAKVYGLKSFIESAPRLNIPFKVYRGIDFKLANIGETFIDWSFQGTSLDFNIAEGFTSSNCCIYELNLPPNFPFLFIGYISKHPSEYEIILPAGCEFIIKKEKIINGILVFECDFIKIHDIIPQLNYTPDDIKIDTSTKINIKSILNISLNTYISLKRLMGEDEAKMRLKKNLLDNISNLYNKYLGLISKTKILEIYKESISNDSDRSKIISEINLNFEGGKQKLRKTSKKNNKLNKTQKRRKNLRQKQ